MAFPCRLVRPWRHWLNALLHGDIAALCPNLVREIDTGLGRAD